MAQGIGELVARFESARQNLASVLGKTDGDTGSLIVAADRELSSVFSQIMDVNLDSNEDRAARIEFLLNEIIAASDQDGLVSKLAEQVIDDVRRALDEEFPINQNVPKVS